MSMTTDCLLEQQIADSPEKCPDCKINWDDKFYDYCPKHQAEMENQVSQLENEWILGWAFAARS